MNRKLLALPAAALAFLLAGCGDIVNMGPSGFSSIERRIYLNDAAPNDSLPSVLINGGVYFVMQPGKQYELRVRTATPGEPLVVLKAIGNYYYGWKTITPTTGPDSTQIYALRPDSGEETRYYRAALQSLVGGTGTRPNKVRFVPAGAAPTTASLHVKVVMLRQLTGLSEAKRPAFAQALLDELISVYSAFGLQVSGSYSVLEPDAARFIADFGTENTFPGPRGADTAYLYVVDNVRLDGDENSSVLGFAPREGFSLATDAVVLNVRGMDREDTTSPAAMAKPLAVTAAHELGHLYGLRHTTSSKQDIEADFDKSNTHDGFAPLGERCVNGMEKRSSLTKGGETFIRAPDGRQYCLRVAKSNAQCGTCPDQTNLMYAFQCNGAPQKALAPGQLDLLRWNISLFLR